MRNYSKKDFQNFKIIVSFLESTTISLVIINLIVSESFLVSDRVIGIRVLDYNPVLPKVGSVIAEHYMTMVSDNQELLDPFPKPPTAALRQGS